MSASDTTAGQDAPRSPLAVILDALSDRVNEYDGMAAEFFHRPDAAEEYRGLASEAAGVRERLRAGTLVVAEVYRP